jgi:hypothetical protein
MPARTTREEARKRVIAAFMSSLDKVIPADASVPLKGARFADWEDQAAALRRALIPTLLEERSALEENAQVSDGGRCPFCSSDRVYLKKDETQSEVVSPDGPVVLPQQHCRCRQCGGTFSPSAT